MSGPVIFKDLPATFPERDKYKKPSFVSSIVFHGLLIFAVIIVPLLIPQTIPERELLVTLVSPIGPPPPPPPPPVEVPVVAVPKAVQLKARPVTPDSLVEPIFIPKEVAKIVEEPIAPTIGVVGGVPGGIPGGVAGGVLGGILSANAAAAAPALAPPPHLHHHRLRRLKWLHQRNPFVSAEWLRSRGWSEWFRLHFRRSHRGPG
jgi:hypothetical protein